jgi:protein FAM50
MGQSRADILEEQFREETIGLVSAEEFAKKRKMIDEAIAKGGLEDEQTEVKKVAKSAIKKSTLSFADDDEDEEEEEEVQLPKKRLGKNPTVDTSFLPDEEREAAFEAERDALIAKYKEEQETIKKTRMDVVYSYWDGSGHRRSTNVMQGMTVGLFLAKVKKEIEGDFPELRAVTVDNLMYIKEDIIIPQNVTFYELIKNKVKGKSGPLFDFSAKEDIGRSSAGAESKETHAGKIVARRWYETNKHIFPASRWEQYDPAKAYEKYTIKGEAVPERKADNFHLS